MFLSGS